MKWRQWLLALVLLAPACALADSLLAALPAAITPLVTGTVKIYGTQTPGPNGCPTNPCDVQLTAESIAALGGGGGGGITSIGMNGSGILSFTPSVLTANGSFSAIFTGTVGSVPCFSGGTTLSTSAAMTANTILLGAPGSSGCIVAFSGCAAGVLIAYGTPPTCGPTYAGSQLGPIGLPVSGGAAKTSSYPLVLSDNGEQVVMNCGSACTVTIPANSSVAFPYTSGAGTCIVINVVPGSATVMVAITSDVLTLYSPSAPPGTRTLAAPALATICKYGATNWFMLPGSNIS